MSISISLSALPNFSAMKEEYQDEVKHYLSLPSPAKGKFAARPKEEKEEYKDLTVEVFQQLNSLCLEVNDFEKPQPFIETGKEIANTIFISIFAASCFALFTTSAIVLSASSAGLSAFAFVVLNLFSKDQIEPTPQCFAAQVEPYCDQLYHLLKVSEAVAELIEGLQQSWHQTYMEALNNIGTSVEEDPLFKKCKENAETALEPFTIDVVLKYLAHKNILSILNQSSEIPLNGSLDFLKERIHPTKDNKGFKLPEQVYQDLCVIKDGETPTSSSSIPSSPQSAASSSSNVS